MMQQARTTILALKIKEDSMQSNLAEFFAIEGLHINMIYKNLDLTRSKIFLFNRILFLIAW